MTSVWLDTNILVRFITGDPGEIAYELRKREKRYGLASLCIGGGQGIAAIIERV